MERAELEQADAQANTSPTILERARPTLLGRALGQSGQDQGGQGARRRLEGEERQVVRRRLALRRQERQDQGREVGRALANGGSTGVG